MPSAASPRGIALRAPEASAAPPARVVSAIPKARRRVCVDCRYIGPRPSGIGEVVQALVDHLPGMAPDLDFLLLKHPQAPARLSGHANVVERVVPQAANGPATMWFLPFVVDLSDVDLFHATYNIMPAGLTMPCVATVHDVMWLTDYRLCNDGLKGRIDRHFFGHGIRRTLKRAAAIATVSDATRAEIARIAPVAGARSTVTLSGVSDDFRPASGPSASPEVAPAVSVPGLPQGRRYVLTVGQYAPYKNHEGALAGFARAFADRPDVDLVFVQRRRGERCHLAETARQLGLEHRVHFPRDLDRDQLVALYRGAAALLHPSFCEGFGNPLAEAMACGCPVVTSDLSAMPEVTGGAALLIDPTDPGSIAAALTRVIDDEGLARSLRESGLARVRQLSWEAFAAANLALYRQVLG